MPPSTRSAMGIVLGALAIVIGARITVPMVPVPMTLQTLAVLAGGLLLGPRRGAAAAGLYALLVVAGLPVLSDGDSAPGSQFLVLKSAGYVVGFVPGAWVAGRIGSGRGLLAGLLGGLAGHAVVLACGVPVLAGWIGVAAAVEYGLVPFLPGAVVKSALAAAMPWATGATVRGRAAK